jgi:hypothetical protein
VAYFLPITKMLKPNACKLRTLIENPERDIMSSSFANLYKTKAPLFYSYAH